MAAGGSAQLTAAELRRARRAFVLAQHPDRGGDPVAFAAGLARFDRLLARPGPTGPTAPRPTSDPTGGPLPRVVVVRRPRGVAGRLRHLTDVVAGVCRPGAGRHLR